jgi:hypothetical protein
MAPLIRGRWRGRIDCQIVALSISFSGFAFLAMCGGREQMRTDGGPPDGFNASETSSDSWGAGSLDDAPLGSEPADGVAAEPRDSPEESCEAAACIGEAGSPTTLRPCSPQDAFGTPPPGMSSPQCHSALGWAWDGSKCIAIVGCSCQGADCGDLLPIQSACRAAYAHCLTGG